MSIVHICLCDYNHEHVHMKYSLIFSSILSWFCAMFSGPPIAFGSSSTSKASNLVWSTNGCDIFVDYVGNGQLFVDSSYFLKMFVLFLSWMFLYVVLMCMINFFMLTFF